jgi:hypothetical protein
LGAGWVAGFGAGVEGGQDGGDVVGGGVGEDGVDGDLVVVLVVEQLEVEGLVELGEQAFGGVGEVVGGERGQGVEQGRVLGGFLAFAGQVG